jgi:hypothetical protein
MQDNDVIDNLTLRQRDRRSWGLTTLATSLLSDRIARSEKMGTIAVRIFVGRGFYE